MDVISLSQHSDVSRIYHRTRLHLRQTVSTLTESKAVNTVNGRGVATSSDANYSSTVSALVALVTCQCVYPLAVIFAYRRGIGTGTGPQDPSSSPHELSSSSSSATLGTESSTLQALGHAAEAVNDKVTLGSSAWRASRYYTLLTTHFVHTEIYEILLVSLGACGATLFCTQVPGMSGTHVFGLTLCSTLSTSAASVILCEGTQESLWRQSSWTLRGSAAIWRALMAIGLWDRVYCTWALGNGETLRRLQWDVATLLVNDMAWSWTSTSEDMSWRVLLLLNATAYGAAGAYYWWFLKPLNKIVRRTAR